MDWSNEPYVRVYTRETDDDLLLTWEARALWDRMMTKFDRSGFVETKRGVRGLAAITRMPVEVVQRVLPELLEDGRLVENDGGYLAPNFIAAQEAVKSDRLRALESRSRRRSHNLERSVTKRDADITNRDDSSRSHPSSSRGVTLTSADPDPRHTSAARAPAEIAEPARPELPEKIQSLDAEQNARYQLVTEIWNRLAAVRTDLAAELGETTRPLAPFDRGKSELAARIREIGDLERARADCEHVLAVRVDEARNKRELKWLTGAIFGVDSMRAALGSSRQEAKRARPSPGSDGNGLMRPKLPWAVDS